jgi:endonuclease G
MPQDASRIVFHEKFAACVDARTRNPRWVMERISRQSLKGSASRQGANFKVDPALADPRFGSRPRDFVNTGLDRGHMSPAANHYNSDTAMAESFLLSNVSPQVGVGFNRGYWAGFEAFVRGLAHSTTRDVYVVTGPLFLPVQRQGATVADGARGAHGVQGAREVGAEQPSAMHTDWVLHHGVIGTPPRMVSVPTHFFKVILLEADDGTLCVGAFVLPNEPIDPDTPLSQFIADIDGVECAAGLRIFPGLLERGGIARLDAEGALHRAAAGAPPPSCRHLQLGARSGSGSGSKKGKGEGGGEGLRHLCSAVPCKLPPRAGAQAGAREEALLQAMSGTGAKCELQNAS